MRRDFTGFPSPAEEYSRAPLSLDSLLIRFPLSTFFARYSGDAMTPVINDGDLLIVEKCLHYPPGCLLLAFVDGQRIVRSFELRDESALLCPANQRYGEIELTDAIEVFGRVIHSITHYLQIKHHVPVAM